MGLIKWLFGGKPKSILTQEQQNELATLQQNAYMEEARKLVEEQAKAMARDQLIPKKKESIF